MRALDLQYDQLIIGADLSALLFAYVNKIPVIYYKHKKPYEFPKEEGFENKNSVWEFCMFNLAINGYVPIADKVQSIRIGEDVVKVTTKNNFLINIKYNKLWISDDERVEGLPLIEGKTNDQNHVLDLFYINDDILLEPITNFEDDFVKQVIYRPCPTYKKHRISILVYSKITDDEIKSYECSETYTRLKLLRNFKRKFLEAWHQSRTIIPIGKNIYEETDRIKNLLLTPEEILSMEPKKIPYERFLEETLWNKLKIFKKE